MTKSVAIREAVVSFGGANVLDHINLQVNPGELLAILGPSGCGKSTLLNMVAGFIRPRTGRLFIGDLDVTDVPTQGRKLSMVFQNYALFPHMTAFSNVAYGLEVRRLPRGVISEKVRAALRTVGLEGFEHRYPRQLSGGQQQRVALARAMAVEPDVLLLDEPLSNLDAKLRRDMRVEIKQLQRRLRTTTILVTHDQEEALSMADRVAVMQGGQVQQIASPLTVYNSPSSHFVAEFVGRTNSFRGRAGRDNTGSFVECGPELRIPVQTMNSPVGSTVIAVVRPEVVRLANTRQSNFDVSGVIRYRGFIGSSWESEIELECGGTVVATAPSNHPYAPSEGDNVFVGWDASDVILLTEA